MLIEITCVLLKFFKHLPTSNYNHPPYEQVHR